MILIDYYLVQTLDCEDLMVRIENSKLFNNYLIFNYLIV